MLKTTEFLDFGEIFRGAERATYSKFLYTTNSKLFIVFFFVFLLKYIFIALTYDLFFSRLP